jgi:hypothetical protein
MEEREPIVRLEEDWRFPSGPWTGFFLQPSVPGRHWMELKLTFGMGRIQGAGRDWVGPFLLKGDYELEGGVCRFVKQYVGRHAVYYRGYNEGKGIWGVWTIVEGLRGGFHIWPEGQADPTGSTLREALNEPTPEPSTVH